MPQEPDASPGHGKGQHQCGTGTPTNSLPTETHWHCGPQLSGVRFGDFSLNIQRNSCFILCQSYRVYFVFLLLAKSLIIYSCICQSFLIPLFALWCQILGFLFDIPNSSCLLRKDYRFNFGLSLPAESGHPQQCSSEFLRPLW